MDIAPSNGCLEDKLVIYGTDQKEVLGRVCGAELPYPIISLPGENEIRLLFRTDYMFAGKGFKLQYESAPGMSMLISLITVILSKNWFL